MLLIGVDYHPSFQQVAFLNQDTGECGELCLNHSDGEAERFYRELQQRGISVCVGMEATGYSRWFERLLAELGFEVWIGDPAEIKTRRVKKQKTDRKDAQLLLRLMREDDIPDLGNEPRESGSTTTAVAPTSNGADACADSESAAGVGDERRQALQEKAVARAGASRVTETCLSAKFPRLVSLCRL